ncbi:MAG: hypothetical protein Q8Q50_04805 [Methylobacter sp.]|nr:hypothetical protein [Methylobacter sp.]
MNIKWLIDVGCDDGQIDQMATSIESAFRAAGLVAPQEIVVNCVGIGAALFDSLKHRGLPVCATL